MKKLHALAFSFLLLPLTVCAIPMNWNDGSNFKVTHLQDARQHNVKSGPNVGSNFNTAVGPFDIRPGINDPSIEKIRLNPADALAAPRSYNPSRSNDSYAYSATDFLFLRSDELVRLVVGSLRTDFILQSSSTGTTGQGSAASSVSVTEPGSLALLGLGLIGLGLARRRLSKREK